VKKKKKKEEEEKKKRKKKKKKKKKRKVNPMDTYPCQVTKARNPQVLSSILTTFI